MELLTGLDIAAGGVLFAAAALHLTLALKGHQRQLSATFAAACIFASAEAFGAPLRQSAKSLEEFIFWLKASIGPMMIFTLMLVWFARAYANIQGRWVPITISVGVAISTIAYVSVPYSLFFSGPPTLQLTQMPWGEYIVLPVGSRHPWLPIAQLSILSTILYSTYAEVKLWRDGERRRAVAYTLGLAPLVVIVYPYGVLVNSGFIKGPHLYAFAFLGISLIMGLSLLNEAVESSNRQREIAENERRWSSLLENVSLLVVGYDCDGRLTYVNPYFTKTTGYQTDEILGDTIDRIIPADILPRVKNTLRLAFERGEVPASGDMVIRTKDGHDRTVVFSNVILRDAQNSVTGLLSVGSDVTEGRALQDARDKALQEIQGLKAQLEQENTFLKFEIAEVEGSHQIIGQSDAVRYVLHKIHQVAHTDATVLIEGETGVGKELVARSVHEQSSRARMPFIRVNCAALPATLVESELFGHEKGSFTGADRLRKGRFELANGGTLFLDEIGELSLEVQAKLLRVLQEGEYERLGSSETRTTDVRIIAATNRSLRREVAAGRFREDLFYRLSVYPISVPPLRDRREDIPALVEHFVRRLAARHGKMIDEIPASLMQKLTSATWPGNVRELQNAIERAVITTTGRTLSWPTDFGLKDGQALSEPKALLTLAEMEKQYIEQVLERTGGQVAGDGGAAEVLGLHPSTLRARMAKLGVAREISGSARVAGLAKET